MNLYKIIGEKVTLELHEGQTLAWDSEARFTFVISGTQSGKTSFGPWWLWREVERCGPGDYLAVTASYDLFKLKMLPEMLRIFGGIFPEWTYMATDRVLARVNDKGEETRIILRSASAESGLESATARAAWLDECGQDDFTLEAWEAVLRRLSLYRGRVLGTTTPYNLGWLKTQVFDRWRAKDPDYRVVQFKSTQNPAFPRDEYERARRTMQPWKFAMFYNGEFTRPAGLIYDSFDPERHSLARFVVPPEWPRYGGIDFGGVNTAAVCIAENPASGALYVIEVYHDGGKTAAGHSKVLLGWNCRAWVGGAKSEGQWRGEFAAAGMPINAPPIADVEVGIDRVYGAHAANELYVFSDCARYLDEKGRYSRKLDASGQPLEEIANKNEFHVMDAERYILSYLRGGVVTTAANPFYN